MGLIFKPQLIEKILAGQKTQTRRPRKEGDSGWVKHIAEGEYLAVGRNGRRHWQYGHDYAIVPGRGKHAIEGVRIRITRIRQEDVRDISVEDVVAEGFTARHEFLETWTAFYDGAASFYVDDDGLYHWYANRRDKWVTGTEAEHEAWLRQRPDALYQCWALTFEVQS